MDNKKIPQNIEAEKAVLASMFLAKYALQKSVEELTKAIMDEWKIIEEELFKEKYSQKVIKKSIKNIKAFSNKIIDNKITKKQSLKNILSNEQYVKMFKPKTKYDMLAERLGLSAEQKEKVAKIFEEKKDKEIEFKKQLREKDMLLKQEFDKENIDKNAISKLSEEISNITKELFKLDINTKMELKSILTPEQYNKFTKPFPNPKKPIIYEPTDCDKNIDKK